MVGTLSIFANRYGKYKTRPNDVVADGFVPFGRAVGAAL
jgi:hypothetical protein